MKTGNSAGAAGISTGTSAPRWLPVTKGISAGAAAVATRPPWYPIDGKIPRGRQRHHLQRLRYPLAVDNGEHFRRHYRRLAEPLRRGRCRLGHQNPTVPSFGRICVRRCL